MTELLKINQVSKSFGGVQALTNVSFSIQSGEIFGLIGPNGAGKTTLFNLITGVLPVSAGHITFNQCPLQNLPPHKILRLGIARTFQNIRLFSGMTALENVMVGMHSRTHAGILGAILRNAGTRREETHSKAQAHHLLTLVGISRHSNTLAANLPYGDQRRLEIARALASQPRLLALDEPAAGMNPSERDSLRELMHALHQEFNLTLLVIEHDVQFMMQLCHRMAVLDFGELVTVDTPDKVRHHPRVIQAWLGGDT